jgi:hypothetical protein
MKRQNYYLHKNSKTGEITYLEYDKIDGYKITPRTKVEDAIKVNKIVFVSPNFSEKIIKKKIDIKIRQLLNILATADEDGGDDEDTIRKSLLDAEKLRNSIINNYVKYLGHTYEALTMKKIQVIINQLRIKLFNVSNRNRIREIQNLYYLDEDEEKLDKKNNKINKEENVLVEDEYKGRGR